MPMTAQMILLKPYKTRNKLWYLKHEFLKGVLVFFLTFISVWLFNDHIQILRNTSDSMPYKVFLYFPKVTPHKGDITVYQYEGQHIIKQIVGTEGDAVHYDVTKNLHVGDFKVGSLQRKDNQGKTLYGIARGTIPQGFVFLYAPHPQSLDSRYTLLGFVERHHLKGTAIALF